MVRPAVSQDLDALVEIDAKCFPVGIAYPRAEIAALLRSGSVLMLVAEMQEAIVGFAAVGQFQHQFRRRSEQQVPWFGELITLDVLPDFRRARVGWQLHQALEDWLRAGNALGMKLHVAVDNASALRFYECLGYHSVALISGYYLDTIDAWQMEKRLASIPADESRSGTKPS